MKTFTQKSDLIEGSLLLKADKESCITIDVPLQKMFDDLITFISFADLE